MSRDKAHTTDEELALGCLKFLAALVALSVFVGFLLAVVWHAVHK